MKKLKEKILKYIQDNPKSLSTEIIEAMKVDPWETLEVLYELKEEGKIE